MKKGGGTPKSATSRPNAPGKNYLVYAANFHGSYLNTIHDVYLEQVGYGLRRKIFVINFDQIKEKLTQVIEPSPKAVGKKTAKEKPVTPLQMLLKAIVDCRSEYDRISKQIEKEKSFNLYAYWLGDAETAVTFEDPLLVKRESLRKDAKVKTRRSQQITAANTLFTELSFDLATCIDVQRKEHHLVGHPELLSKRKYIDDHPNNVKIIIVIVGDLDEKTYHALLSHGEPLVGIVHFVPGQMPYDIMVPNKIKETFREETYEEIRQLFTSLRDPDIFKPTGLFKQELPELSYCLAQNLRYDIFNQLTWYFFDLEMLRKYYHDYYVEPYHHVNVIMDKKKNPQHNYEFLQSLGTSGHFIKSSLPASASDKFTISMYLHNLLNSFDEEDDLFLTESEILLYSQRVPLTIASYDKSMESAHVQKGAFNSITKVKKFNRIMVEDGNRLLVSAIATANQKKYRSIFSACLEYYLLRDFIPQPILEKPRKPKSMQLPIFLKYYSTLDSVLQRISALTSKYNEYKTYRICKSYRLYHFKTTYNELFEEETDVVLPSCLCYRDFTLFHLEEFQKWLITPEQRSKAIEDKTTEEERLKAMEKSFNIAESLYIRPNSLRQLYPSIKYIFDCPITRQSVDERASVSTRPSENRKSVIIISQPEVIKKTNWEECDYVGLPPQHPLLHGYTLDDVLQELNSKNSKYFFEEGFLRLYEEKFVRKYTNRKLELCIHENCMNLNSISANDPMVSPTVRITAKNEVSVRIEPHAEEVAKVIITYPNGLSIFYQEDLVEQYWHMEHTFRNECKRVFTPYAAVIVYYKDDDVVLVMRYNGEVYRLYQYEEIVEEEEMLEEDDEEIWATASSNAQGMSGKKSDVTNVPSKIADNTSKQIIPDIETKKSLKSNIENTSTHISKGSLGSAFDDQYSRVTSIFAAPPLNITDVFMNELIFINNLKTVYGLRYVHLKITAASGRIAKISSSNVITDGGHLKYVEWHDYVEDESYCMRHDGVKMLWTKDKFKCFHADGTRFVSRTEEYLEEFDICDEFDPYISTSSSHINEEQESEQLGGFKSRTDMSFGGYVYPCEKRKGKRHAFRGDQRMLYEEGIGEEFEEPNIYVGYNCNDILIQHRNYAAVRFEIVSNSTYNIHLDVFAIDGIHITHDIIDRKLLDSIYKEPDSNDEDHDDFKSKSSESGEEKKFFDEDNAPPVFVPVLKVSFENQFRVAVTPNDCHMLAYLEKYNDLDETEIDVFDFILDFKWDLHKIFYSFIKKMNQFKNYKKPKTKELFFIESISLRSRPKLRPRGFEFFDELPELSDLHVAKSNTLIELIPLQNFDEKFQNEYAHYKRDMLKFPRFRKRVKTDIESEFPPIFSVNTYCKVPKALRKINQIHKFLDPFDEIDFKQQRYHFKEALYPFLKPNLLFEQRKLMSAINWQLHKEAHAKYLHEEQQRITLYTAMLKYKEYPRYFPFMQKMCGKVENIDFVDFFRVMYERKIAEDARKEMEEQKRLEEEALIGPRRRRLMSECHRRSMRSNY